MTRLSRRRLMVGGISAAVLAACSRPSADPVDPNPPVPPTDERLKALEGRPGFAAGARVHRSTPLPFESDGVAIPPVPPQLMLLIWCEQPDLGLIARAVGPRSLNPWPGHLHADGEWIAIAGMPHLSLVGSTPPTVPDWLLRLIVDQTVAV